MFLRHFVSVCMNSQTSSGEMTFAPFKRFFPPLVSVFQELEFSNLFAVLHCIHAFFAAKVACLDPMFVESQGNAATTGFPSLTGIPCNPQTPKLKYAT